MLLRHLTNSVGDTWSIVGDDDDDTAFIYISFHLLLSGGPENKGTMPRYFCFPQEEGMEWVGWWYAFLNAAAAAAPGSGSTLTIMSFIHFHFLLTVVSLALFTSSSLRNSMFFSSCFAVVYILLRLFVVIIVSTYDNYVLTFYPFCFVHCFHLFCILLLSLWCHVYNF